MSKVNSWFNIIIHYITPIKENNSREKLKMTATHWSNSKYYI